MDQRLSVPDMEKPWRNRLVAASAASLLSLSLSLQACSADTRSVEPEGLEPVVEAEQTPDDTETPQESREQEHSGEFSAEPSWFQDFRQTPDGPIDESVWTYELNPEVPGYNEEAQAYTNQPKNVRIENGKLIIQAHRESYTYPNDQQNRSYGITSGRIDTRNSLNFEFGKFEVTAKLPEDSGTWPAVWFLSANQPFTDKYNPTDEMWSQDKFYLHDGEIDLAEAYGDQPGKVEGTLHTFDRVYESMYTLPDNKFHVYSIEITPDKVVWAIDGSPYQVVKKPSNNPDKWPIGKGNKWYAITNLAMGSAGGEPDSGVDVWTMQVKKIEFFEYTARKK